ncbi:MAG: glycosyltransferase family 2 protein [Opitutales bacterium]|nr:glycosyltransferase family 2 protein [Opitutales bacterium]
MTDAQKVSLSVILPVKNEAANLARALASVEWADDIWVVDSQSTDQTVEIARERGAQVAQFDFNGVWPKKKNWALENLPLKNEWVLLLDADEVMPAASSEEIAAIVSDPQHPVDGYWINRRFCFMGKWMRHAYYPNWNLRLFRHRKGRFERLATGNTRSGDNEVHEHVLLDGSSGRLKAEMDHFPFPDVETFIEKHNRYSNWEAEVAYEQGHRRETRKSEEQINRKRRLKRWAARLPFRPFLRFLWVYIGQRAILDGREGYYFARLHAIYEALSVMKLYELRKQRGRQGHG